MKRYVLALLAICACGGDEVARVGNKTVTRQEFDAYLRLKNLEKADDKRRGALLDQYLEREAMAQAIETTDRLDRAVVEAELNEMRKETLISRYFERYLKDTVTDDAVKSRYAADVKGFEEQRVHVAHILVRANPGMSEAERQARLTKARAAYSKVNTGADFAKVVSEFSEDTISAKKEGDLGWLKEGAIDPEFSKRVFAMKTGELSEPFATAFGYHIVKLLEGPVVNTRALEEVQGDLRYRLRNEAKEAEVQRLKNLVSVKRKG
jgi:peptidyl-prolyl cis-trans isomerase C